MMESLLDMLRGYFQFSFVRYALVAGVLIARVFLPGWGLRWCCAACPLSGTGFRT